MTNIFDRITETPDSNEPAKTDAATAAPALIETNNSDNAQTAEGQRTDNTVKELTQELLRRGYIEESTKPVMFRHSITHETAINNALEPLDLILKLDTHRGVAWIGAHSTNDDLDAEWSHPLVRRQRLTLEQSLVIALLRHAFVMHEQEDGIGQSACRVAVDDLLPQYLTYFQDTGSDNKNESNLLRLLDQLKTYGIVSEVDKNQDIFVRPMIAHLANPESLSALLNTLKEKSANNIVNSANGNGIGNHAENNSDNSDG